MPYLGNIPATQFSSLAYQDLTGGTGTAFTLDNAVGSAQDIEVFVNNVRQEPGVAYTVSGTSLTMTGSIVATDDFYVVFQGKAVASVTHPSNSALNATTGTFSNGLSVDGGSVKLDGNYPTGTNNVALGNAALDDASLSGASNVAIGFNALTVNTSGASNTSVGTLTLDANTTGGSNVALGYGALTENTTASNNTAIGTNALSSNTTASHNTAVGWKSLFANTTGAENTAVGRTSLENTTTGTDNTAVGYACLSQNTTGNYNTAIGNQALNLNTTGGNSTAVGYQAGFSNTSSGLSTYIGRQAGYSTTGERNTFVGTNAGYSVTTGTGNTFIGGVSSGAGNGAGRNMTTGSKNTILGTYDGNQGGLDIRTSDNNIVLSDGDGNPRLSINSSGHMASPSMNSSATANSDLRYNSSNGAIYYQTSSLRYKSNVTDIELDTSNIYNLRPVSFDDNATGERTYGLIAEETYEQIPQLVNLTDIDGEQVPDNIPYSMLSVLLLAEMKKLKVELDEAKARITALESA